MTVRSPARWRRTLALIVALAVGGLVLGACGDTSTLGIAAGSTTTTIAASSPHGNVDATELLVYSSCVRSHGVPNYPDPTGDEGIPKETAPQLGVSQSQLQATQRGCAHVLPAGGTLSGTNNQTITVAQQQIYQAAACMRSQGVTNFSEPSFFGCSVELQGLGRLPGVVSPLFKHSFDICRKLIPADLPYGAGSSR